MVSLFDESKKKVKETLTIVEMIKQHDKELEYQKNETRKALRRNQKLLDENKKHRYIQAKLKRNVRYMSESIKKEPTPEKQMKLRVYQSVLEELECQRF